MSGQGRPNLRQSLGACLTAAPAQLSAFLALLITFAWLVLLPPQSLHAQETEDSPALEVGPQLNSPDPNAVSGEQDVELRLRLAWGGGPVQSWQGSISISSGTLLSFIPLGLEADVPGSLYLSDSMTLQVQPHSPSQFDGCDILLRAPADATLKIELLPLVGKIGARGNDAPRTIEVPIKEIARQLVQRKLDEAGSQFLAQRSPGDRLAVKMDRPHLIFAPGEVLDLPLALSRIDLQANTSYLLELRTNKARTGEEQSSDRVEFKTDATATPAAQPQFSVKLPTREGVYDVNLSLYTKRITTSLVKGKPTFTRTVQVIVLDPQLAAASPPALQSFHLLQEIEPTKAHWWEKMGRMKSLKNLSGMNTNPVGSDKAQTRSYLGQNLLELRPGGWHAYPLELERPGEPHQLVIEYPNDWRQSVSISIVEPNAAGQVVPIGVDSGLEVNEPAVAITPALQKSTIHFWPRTKTPWVLIANRREDSSALIGKLSLMAGPASLPPLDLSPVPSLSGSADTSKMASGRGMLAYMDRPLLAENFSASQSVDRETGRSLEDWQTVYEGTARLIEHLKHHGYTGAIVTVACEGGTLYPSEKLEPTPQWGSGVFFESGQDPQRKDVVELLHQMFDRAGLTLVPAVKFSTPLPELESQFRADPDIIGGLMPIGADGKTWIQRNGLQRGQGVFYNTLDPRVQRAMRDVLEELSQRYGHHRSFGGVCVPWDLEGYALLPDDAASVDDATIDRFSKQTHLELPKLGPQRFAQRGAQLRTGGPQAKEWLDFRAAEMATFYRRIQADLARQNVGARLYLGTGQLLAAKSWQPALRPALPAQPNLRTLLLQSGIDPTRLSSDAGIVLPRPQRFLPAAAESEGVQTYWNASEELNQLTTSAAQPSAQHFLEAAPLRLLAFDKASPFGADKTRSWFVSQFGSSGSTARQRFVRSMMAADMQLLMDGGWMLPLNDLQEIQPLVEVYRQLPAELFQTVQPPADQQPSQQLGVVVRQLRQAGGTTFYVINPHPWPVQVAVQLSGKEIGEALNLSSFHDGALSVEGKFTVWTCQLEAFDLAGAQMVGNEIRVTSWKTELSSEVRQALAAQVRDLRLRASSLRTPEAKEWLANPGFEAPPAQVTDVPTIAGWIFPKAGSASVQTVSGVGHESRHAVQLTSHRNANNQPSVAWLRSDPFTPPKTGRLTLFAWIKPTDPSHQPKLRMAMEGKYDGKTYYRRRNLGASEDGRAVKPLQDGWALYRFSVNDLPLTGLSEMRVGFDLMDEGEVLIDDVHVYDLWFEDYERDELLKTIATADFQLSSGGIDDAQNLVAGYWGRFLRDHVAIQTQNLARLPTDTTTSEILPDLGANSIPSKTAVPAPPKPAGMFDKMKNWWSKPGVR